MRGLNGHVSIEEYACFPLYQQVYPAVKLDFLVDDHKELHRAEEHVVKTLRNLQNDAGGKDDELILSALEVVLDFDDHLMAHLGEEEEIVVPLSLTDKPIWF